MHIKFSIRISLLDCAGNRYSHIFSQNWTHLFCLFEVLFNLVLHFVAGNLQSLVEESLSLCWMGYGNLASSWLISYALLPFSTVKEGVSLQSFKKPVLQGTGVEEEDLWFLYCVLDILFVIFGYLLSNQNCKCNKNNIQLEEVIIVPSISLLYIINTKYSRQCLLTNICKWIEFIWKSFRGVCWMPPGRRQAYLAESINSLWYCVILKI